MTSKMQRSQVVTVYREELETSLSCFGCELKKNGGHFNRGKIAKSTARTARRQLEGRHLLFGD